MFSREDYLLNKISNVAKIIAKLVALIESKRLEDAQKMVIENIDLGIQNALLQNDIILLSKTKKQLLEFQIELVFRQIIILNTTNDEKLKLNAHECLKMIKNYGQLNSLTFNIALLYKINILQSIINNDEVLKI